MGILRLALGNFHGVVVLALLILVLGAVALASIPVDILPVFKAPAVQVLTYFNGMPARSIERTITDRIERWVNQSPGIRQVESRSVVGVSVVKLYFQDDVDPTTALTMSSSLAAAARPYLPTNTLPPVLLPFDPTGTLPLGILTVSNPTLGEASVKDLARVNVRNMLGAVRGAVAPVVVGGKEEAEAHRLAPQRLAARHLSAVDVVKARAAGYLMVSPGTAYFGDSAVSLDTNMMVRTVEELNDLPVRVGTQQVLLRDIGHAEDAAVIQKSRVRIDGRPQVYVPIYRQGGSSSLAVAGGVRAAIPEMESQLEPGSKLEFVMDQSEGVRKAIHSLIEEGAIGGILVGVMILVFLGNWRMTLVATLSMPLAILAAIVGLYATGNTINVMTLGGLFLAIGPLVDNAIVVLENIHRHQTMGKSAVRAAFDGPGELTLPVLVATTVTIIVLCPVALTPGIAGFLFRPLTLAVGFAMIASFVLSWTFVPAMCAKLLKSHAHHHPGASATGEPSTVAGAPGWYARFDAVLTAVTRGYGAVLNVALHHRLVVLGVAAAAFAGSLMLFPAIGQEFFPQVDAGQITLNLRGPSDWRLDATERRVADVERFIADQIPPHERKTIISEIGLNPDWSSAYTQNAGQQDAILRVQLTEDRTKSAQEYAIQMRHAFEADPRFADLRVSFDTGGMVTAALNFGASSPIDVQIGGGDREKAMALAREIRNRVAGVPGATDVRVLQRADAPYLIIDVDRQKAAAVGLSARDVVMQVVTAMNSSIAMTRNFWIDTKSGNQYFVAVQYPEDPSFSIPDLQNVVATGTRQSLPVQLASLVTLRRSTADVEINHSGLRRTLDVLVNTEHRDTGSVAADIRHRLADLPVPEGMRVELKGEYARMTESFKSLGIGLALAAILVYLVLAPLLRSFVSPLIILFTIPLGLIGVLTMLYTTGTTLNIMSEVGVIFLVGIVVTQGVLLLDFANQLRRKGATVREAVTQAAAIRFRPILMTFLATFLDLLPMAIGFGKGSESIAPLARAVVGGLLTSTALTLIVVPVLYTLLIREQRGPQFDLDAELSATPTPMPHPNS